VAYNTPQALDLVEQAGAEVDRERLTARLGSELIERCLGTAPREVLLAGRDPAHDRVLGRDPLVATSDGMATYVRDDLTGERRPGTEADLARFTRLVDALPELDVHWPSPQTSDVAADVMPLAMQAVCCATPASTSRTRCASLSSSSRSSRCTRRRRARRIEDRPIFSVTNCTIAPLQHDRDMTEASLKLPKRGVPIFVLPMPQAGTTGPMSVLGTCILNIAELLSAVVLYQLSAPGCPCLRRRLGRGRHAQRGLHRGRPRDRAHQHALHRDEPLQVRSPTQATGSRATPRPRLPGGLGGRHERPRAPRSPAPTRSSPAAASRACRATSLAKIVLD
jgi:trimethylamine---corrinoid protein Co-methyltransferase